VTSLGQPRHVLVIGAGVVGYACALALQARGWRVTLTDPDRAVMAASWGNAGHIATEQVEPLASLAMLRSAVRRHYAFGGALDIRNPMQLAPWILRYLKACAPRRFQSGREALRGLLADALPAWRRLAAAVRAPQLLRETGHWVCWESAGSAQRGRRGWRSADTGTASFSDLEDDQLESLRTRLRSTLAGGIAFEGTAQIVDPVALSGALAAQFARNGGERRFDRIDALADQDGRVHARTVDGAALDADAILVCAGVRSRELMASIGVTAPLVAERGYHLQWRDHEWPDLPPVVFEDRSMIVTRFEGGLRVASFVEYAAVDAPPDPGKWRRLHQHVRQLGIPVHGQPVQWFGARPTLPDYLPAIGRSARFGNLYYAFGHQHLGLTLAAITGEMIGGVMAGDGAPGNAAFAIERFGR
jgi:glycine/D-amino acid oxidase-like deaminating enzyme